MTIVRNGLKTKLKNEIVKKKKEKKKGKKRKKMYTNIFKMFAIVLLELYSLRVVTRWRPQHHI